MAQLHFRMNRGEYLRSWSQAHGYSGGEEVSGIARAYLALNFYLVQPFVLLKFTPNFVTLLGPLLGDVGTIVGRFRDHLGIILVPLWDHFWDRFLTL